MRSAPTLNSWMMPFSSVAMMEKRALLRIALRSALALGNPALAMAALSAADGLRRCCVSLPWSTAQGSSRSTRDGQHADRGRRARARRRSRVLGAVVHVAHDGVAAAAGGREPGVIQDLDADAAVLDESVALQRDC